MSTPTEHLGLHQWEPEDAFLRTDFNEDFAKLDAAAGALQEWASSVSVAGSVLITDYKADINVDLGFRPKLVIYAMNGADCRLMNLCIDGMAIGCYARGSAASITGVGSDSTITDTGFRIARTSLIVKADENNTLIHYVAFR